MIALLAALLFFPLLQMQAQDKWAQYRDSLRVATEELAYHPDSIYLLLRKASWNVELEQWDYAKETYDQVLKLDPNNLSALYYRAFVNRKLRRYRFARHDYEALLRLSPSHYEGQLGLALLCQEDNRKTEALDIINNVVNNFPDSATAWAARAGIEVENKTYETAEYDYTEALKRDSTNKDYLLARADVRIKLGRLGEARRDLDELVRLGTPRMSLKTWYDKTREKKK
jgi:tetratricopeptide (TPR) repeat protein